VKSKHFQIFRSVICNLANKKTKTKGNKSGKRKKRKRISTAADIQLCILLLFNFDGKNMI